MARLPDRPIARRGARSPRAAPPVRVHGGGRPAHPVVGRGGRQPVGARRPGARPACARLPRDRGGARATAPSSARARCWATSTSRRSRRRSPPGSSSAPASSRSSPRRTCSARAGSRARRRGSRRGAATRSPTSSRPATSRSTASTGWAGTRASSTASSPASERDYLVLEYAKKDKLYVPSDAVGMVARYIGGDVPRIHRMGGSDWARATAKVKRAVRDMAGELVRLFTVRMSVPGHAFAPDTPWQRELEDAFPWEETPDQLRVIDDVKRDMERPVPMDRLLCGDVGFGKTEVAVRAASKAVMGGKQVAVLVPTTLLAEQHFLTFRERFAPFPVTVQMLSRFVDPRAAGRDRRRPRGGQGRHRDRDPPAARQRREVRRPRAARRRRGAAVRRLAQGAAQGDAGAGGRADDDGDTDPAHARDGVGRHPPDEHDRHAAGGPPTRAHVRRVVR